MKHIKIVFLVEIVAVIALVMCFKIIPDYQSKKETQQLYLENKYWHEGVAFGMNNPSTSYQDFSHVSVNGLIIRLASYSYNIDNVDITVGDIKEFLSSEYDEQGKPRVLDPPQKIAEYFDWYWNGGGYEAADEYRSWLLRYHLYYKDQYGGDELNKMDEDSLYKMIDDFNSCPDKDIYMDAYKFNEKLLSD